MPKRRSGDHRDSGGKAIAVGADVSKAADVARLFKEVDSAFGRLDVLVNNAGVFRFGAFAPHRIRRLRQEYRTIGQAYKTLLAAW